MDALNNTTMGPQKRKTFQLRLILLTFTALGFVLSIPAIITVWRGECYLFQTILSIPDAIFVSVELALMQKPIKNTGFVDEVWPSIRTIMDAIFFVLYLVAVILQWAIPRRMTMVGTYANLVCLITMAIHLYLALHAGIPMAKKYFQNAAGWTALATGPRRCVRCQAEIDMEAETGVDSDHNVSKTWMRKDRSVDVEAGELLLARGSDDTGISLTDGTGRTSTN